MGIYYSAVEGDPLDSGGNSRVIEGASNFTIEGEDGRSRGQAFIGHKAYCDACKSVGAIVAAPGSPSTMRMHDLQLGRRQALGGDLVLCKCERHPRIIPVHGRRWIIDDGDGEAGANAARAAELLSFDDRYVLRKADGRPICNTRYAIQRGDGSPEIPTGVAAEIQLTLAAQCSPVADRTETFPRTLSADLADSNQRMAFVIHGAQRFDMLLNGPARRDIDQSLRIIATGASLR